MSAALVNAALKVGCFAIVFSLTLAISLADAEQGLRNARIGYLSNSADVTDVDAAFLDGLRELGYGVDTIAARYSAGQDDALPRLAAELVRLRVDVLVTWGATATTALKKETDKIPIVFLSVADPVTKGFVFSLARPGGNLTGVAAAVEEYSAKRVEVLKQMVPRAKRFGIFMNETTMKVANRMDNARKELTQAAELARVGLQWFAVNSAADLPKAFADMGAAHLDGVIVLGDPGVFWIHRQTIAENFLRLRLPTVQFIREAVVVGGLMSYGPNLMYTARRGAYYADRIVRGARPNDLPVEIPTKIELMINLKTAKALGLTIPPGLLARADQVIE